MPANKSNKFKPLSISLAAIGLSAASANAAFVAYHDFGATTGSESTGNITTHQSGTGGTVTLDTSAKALINYADGSATGVTVSIAGANAMDARNGGESAPPAPATPADSLFNVAGLDLSNGLIYEGGNGGSGLTTFTLSGLDPSLLYDLAFFGHRTISADGPEEFILGGVDASTNSSSTGIFDSVTTRLDTRGNTAGDYIRWTGINPGADGTITVTMNPEFHSGTNIAYVSAMRLEEAVPEPSSLALLGLGGLTLILRRRR